VINQFLNNCTQGLTEAQITSMLTGNKEVARMVSLGSSEDLSGQAREGKKEAEEAPPERKVKATQLLDDDKAS
jgi:hypothetical protein